MFLMRIFFRALKIIYIYIIYIHTYIHIYYTNYMCVYIYMYIIFLYMYIIFKALKTTEDEMARWHHWLDGHESEWTPGVVDGQGGLACCYSWDRRVGHDWATDLIWSDLIIAANQKQSKRTLADSWTNTLGCIYRLQILINKNKPNIDFLLRW